MYYGKGAGKLPTASAVVADVIDAARHVGKNVPCYWEGKEAKLLDFNEVSHSFFVRVKAEALEEIKSLVPGGEVVNADVPGQAGILTGEIKEKDFAAIESKLGEKILGKIRVYKEN